MSNNNNEVNTITQIEPLLPCPFCGGEADEEFKEETITLYVQCTKCRARGTSFYGHGYRRGSLSGRHAPGRTGRLEPTIQGEIICPMAECVQYVREG
jgi:hypothetical protein